MWYSGYSIALWLHFFPCFQSQPRADTLEGKQYDCSNSSSTILARIPTYNIHTFVVQAPIETRNR